MEVLLYSANGINYVRLLLLIIMILNLRNRPIMSFILAISAGLLDDLDGPIARYYRETSKFGAAIDRSLDRLTTTALYFYLTSKYVKHWGFFFSIGFVEILSN